MRVINLDTQVECTSWGHQGENGATTLVTSLSNLEGTPAVIFQRQDGHPYAHNFYREGENLFITLTSFDTQLVGKCEVSVSVLQGTRVQKKRLFSSFILPSNIDVPLSEEAAQFLDNIPTLKFCDELPASGDQFHLYIVSSSSQAYYWYNNAWQPLVSPSVIRYDKIVGGGANWAATDWQQ